MPDLRPFRALRYATGSAEELSRLICPPYDVISVAERERLMALDTRNAVHVELPAPPGEPADDAAYATAARLWQNWISSGAIARDDRASIYPYAQRYRVSAGGDRVARGFFCVLRLELYGPESGVRPHELTLGAPKEDRFRLLSAVQANLSPVLLLHPSATIGDSSSDLLDRLTDQPPIAHATDWAGNTHTLWGVDPATDEATRLLAIAARQPLTIADGHHRYETALRYAALSGGPQAAGFVLALIYDASLGGLTLRPWHRLLRGIDAQRLVESVPALFAASAAVDRAQLMAELEASAEPGVIGVWTRQAGGRVLRVERESMAATVESDESDALRWLDVSVVSATLRQVTTTTADDLVRRGQLAYSSDTAGAIEAVDKGDFDVAFLLRPTPIQSVIDVAAAGEHMPPKSTYFEPKAATGLVFNPVTD